MWLFACMHGLNWLLLRILTSLGTAVPVEAVKTAKASRLAYFPRIVDLIMYVLQKKNAMRTLAPSARFLYHK